MNDPWLANMGMQHQPMNVGEAAQEFLNLRRGRTQL
jgi:hypothetical protein